MDMDTVVRKAPLPGKPIIPNAISTITGKPLVVPQECQFTKAAIRREYVSGMYYPQTFNCLVHRTVDVRLFETKGKYLLQVIFDVSEKVEALDTRRLVLHNNENGLIELGRAIGVQQIDALDAFRAQRRTGQQPRMHGDRAQIGEQPQRLANAEQSLLRPHLCRWIIPLRAAHRAQQDRVGSAAQRQRVIRQCRAGRIDGAAADARFRQGQGMPEALSHRLQHAHAFRRHLRTDAVARQDYNGNIHEMMHS